MLVNRSAIVYHLIKSVGKVEVKAIVPVAGIGTRLRPHTYTYPKPLLTVAGKPILSYVLEPLLQCEPDEVIFVIGFKSELIRRYVESHYSFKATFVQQDELLGLGYAVRLGMESIDRGPVLVILGDTIVDCDLGDFLRTGDSTLTVCQTSDPKRFGIADIQNGVVIGVEEKPERPKTNLALIGCYYIKESEMLKVELDNLTRSHKTGDGEIQLTDALAAMIRNGVKFVPHEVEHWLDCGKKETLLETNHYILARQGAPAAIDGSVLIPPVYVAPSARLVDSVIGPDVSVADEVEISRSVVRNSIIGEGSRIEDCVLEQSLLGREVIVKGKEEILNIGDSSEVGCTGMDFGGG